MRPIDRLASLVPPPANPVHSVGDWTQVEAALGTALPDDFKDLIHTYGDGELCDFISWFSPFSPTAPMVDEIEDTLSWDRSFRASPDALPSDYPLALYPEAGGVLPWGGVWDRRRLYWLTEGGPNEWHVVAAEWGINVAAHAMGAVEFLARWAEGTLHCPVMGTWDELPEVRPFFEAQQEIMALEFVFEETTATHADRVGFLREVLGPTRLRLREHIDDRDAHTHLFATERELARLLHLLAPR